MIETSVTSYQQRFWANKTISDASRILCLAIGVLTGTFIAKAVGADGIHLRTLMVSSILTATAAAGYIGSYFVEGFIKAALTGIPRHIFYKEAWLKNEVKDRVKLIREQKTVDTRPSFAIVCRTNSSPTKLRRHYYGRY